MSIYSDDLRQRVVETIQRGEESIRGVAKRENCLWR